MKAVIYARYSSDNQREESIEGQIRECMEYDEVKKQWHSVAFTGAVDDQFRDSLLNLGDESFMISYTATSKVELLGTSFEIQYKRTYNDAVLVDRDRKKKIVSLLANGELIELVFQPGKDNTQVDTIKIP
jgi:hypothetical protein